jgi:hypothetical protein
VASDIQQFWEPVREDLNMAVSLLFDGKWLYWNAPGDTAKYHASSGLVEGTDRMFRIGPWVYVFREDYRCSWDQKTKDRGPIPTGTYTVATTIPKNPYATFNAASCSLNSSNSIQIIPRGGDEKDKPSGSEAGMCEPYWANWGYNRAALVPHRDMVAPHRNGFFLHDSSKGFTHGCVETEQRFFTDKLIPLAKKSPGAAVTLKVKYEHFRTYGDTYAKDPNAGGMGLDEVAQVQSLAALNEMCDRMQKNAPNSDEQPFVSKYKKPAGLKLDPPPQDRLLPYDYNLKLVYGSNNLARHPDVLAKLPGWWGNFK